MDNKPSEIIKEYKVNVQGLDFPVRARIIRDVRGDEQHVFLGELSHYCKQFEDAATPYYPSLVRQSIDSLESLIIDYLEKFTTIDVVENEFY
jgi:hypothetical protein